MHIAILKGGYWIGAHDSEEEGHYVWATSRVPVSVSHWAAYQPDYYHNTENCVEVQKSGYWNDEYCPHAKRYICESR